MIALVIQDIFSMDFHRFEQWKAFPKKICTFVREELDLFDNVSVGVRNNLESQVCRQLVQKFHLINKQVIFLMIVDDKPSNFSWYHFWKSVLWKFRQCVQFSLKFLSLNIYVCHDRWKVTDCEGIKTNSSNHPANCYYLFSNCNCRNISKSNSS